MQLRFSPLNKPHRGPRLGLSVTLPSAKAQGKRLSVLGYGLWKTVQGGNRLPTLIPEHPACRKGPVFV